MSDFTPNFDKARTEARGSFWRITQAETQGATRNGLDAMLSERAKNLRAAVFQEAGRAAGAARRAREAVERKYSEQAPSTSLEANARLHGLLNMQTRVAATRTADLVKKSEQMMNDPLNANREVLAAIGAELRKRGESAPADLVGGHLEVPVWEWDDSWREAHDAETMLVKWSEDAVRTEDPQLPDGSPFTVNDLLELSAKDCLEDAGPLPERTRTDSRAAFVDGIGE